MVYDGNEDTRLLHSLAHCRQLASRGMTVRRAEPFGVAMSMHDRVVGIWSFHQGQYRYRSLSSWEPIAAVATLEMVLHLTEWMVDHDTCAGPPPPDLLH